MALKYQNSQAGKGPADNFSIDSCLDDPAGMRALRFGHFRDLGEKFS